MVGSESWARELAYTARFFGPDEALFRGFVSGVFDTDEQLWSEASKLAELIASKSPVAIYTTKKSILYSRDHSVAEGMEHIAMLNGAMLQTNDTNAAVMATMGKKKPVFPKL